MKTILIIGGLLVALLNLLAMVPSLENVALALNALSIVAGAGIAVAATKWPSETATAEPAEPEPKPEPVEAAPPPAAVAKEPDHGELLQLLAQLQEKGRFVDFVMDDVASYSDQQVGAAARVVHQGCQTVLKESLSIVPVTDKTENAAITLEPGYAVSDYRLVGKVQGEPPYNGLLVHKGWKVTDFKLPKLSLTEGAPLPPIAPAQVELK
ncbi:MAG: DUF2760 domain-containing protein [Verrucomicrobiota bacterium]